MDDLYLGPDTSGVAWLFDPASARLTELARELDARTPETPCDPEAVAADLDLLPALIRERHFGIATGRTRAAVEELTAAARTRVAKERPATWGEVLGDLADDLRIALRDRHIRLNGSRPSRIRFDEPLFPVDEAGPAVQVEQRHGVLCVTIRRLWGGPEDDAALWAFAGASAEHFQHERVIVDLRGNTGGNDAIVYEWMSESLPAGVEFPVAAHGWYVSGKPLGLWNSSALVEARDGLAAVPRYHREHRHAPTPQDVLTTESEEDDEPTQAGSRPWRGRMLVLVDGATRSSGESSRWMLRRGLGARVAGTRTAGMIEYGNIVPYLLPNAGLHITLATKHNDFGEPVELVGFPVDTALDPTPALDAVAARFDDLA